jgi:hypothetical protein
MLGNIADRLLVLEDKVGVPITYIERLRLRDLGRILGRERESRGRRQEAWAQAKAEAERVGHRGPIDDFTRRLKAGEFDRPNGR